MSKRYREKNGYFLKDKKAEIFSKVYTRDTAGIETSYFVPIRPIPFWCYTKQINASLEFIARTYDIQEKRMFVFNYNPLIAVYQFVRYRDNWFEITRVDREDDYNDDVYVYVKDYNTPKTNDIKHFGFSINERG